MTARDRDPLVDVIIALAQFFSRTTHWVKTPKGPRHVKEPLKVPHVERHVGGGQAFGLAPIAPGESTTRVANIDFDSHKGEVSWEDMRSHAFRVATTLRTAYGIEPIAFRSSGGKGIHLHMMWKEPQDAYSVRETLREAIEVHGLKNGTRGVKHGEVEIFPKQDSVPADGYGSMWILPLSGESVPLDPQTLDIEAPDAMIGRDWPLSKPVPVRSRPPVQTYSNDDRIDLSSVTSLAEIRSALQAIPNDGEESLDYDAWRNVIFAIHHATQGSAEGLALAHEFSQRSTKYDPEFLDERVWPYVKSERSGKVITEATIFALAREHGWQDPSVLDEFDVVVDEPNSGIELPKPGTELRFQWVTILEMLTRPRPVWWIKGIFPHSELVLLIGQSTAGKSFVALDMAGSIAQGAPWRGRRTMKGRVGYIVAEGVGGFRNRLEAYCQHHGLKPEEIDIVVLPAAPNFLKKEDVKDIVIATNAIGKLDLIIVDTLAQVTPGGNENSGEDMGAALANCKALHHATGATILLVHHVGKDVTKGARGWSGMKAAADAELEVSRIENERLITAVKVKDGEDGANFPFKLSTCLLGTDEDGDPVTSCVIEHLDEVPKSRREPKGANQKRLWNLTHGLIALGGEDITVDALFAEARREMPVTSGARDRRNEILRQALESLRDQGFVEIDNNIVRPLCE